MKYIEKCIELFNQPDTHLVISAWPEKDTNHGIAWYTKLTITEMAKKTHQRFVVLAEKGTDNTPRTYQHGNILVLRVFDNTHPSLYPTILVWLKKFSAVRHVTIHSEFGVTAGLIHYLFLLPFMALIRITGRRITYFAHNVINDITFLAPHFNIDGHPVLIDCINVAIRFHTKCIAKLSDSIVVLDEVLQKRLTHTLSVKDQKKITVVPMPVARHISRYTKARAKELLGIPAHTKIILSFGFISSYKGTDWLVDAFASIGEKFTKNTHLIVAGGSAHSLQNKPHYQRYLDRVQKHASEQKNITITGFIPEEKVPLYFAAADLIVLPYRGIMGGSGALAHAFAYKKPILISNPMQEILLQSDIQTSLRHARMRSSSLVFTMDRNGMKTILDTVKSQVKIHRLTRVTSHISRARSIVKVSLTTYNQVYKHAQMASSSFQAVRYILGAFS
jgi:glycosyltransferase involved in cell wall biosynthesis